MMTKLSRICDAIIEAGWLAALIATPLFFNTVSNRVFEPDKLHLLRSIALLMSAAWIAQLLDTGLGQRGAARGLWQQIRRTPLVLPALILVAAYLVSTALSVTPRISLLGSYVRMQGTFTFLSYAVIFAMVLTHLRTRDQLNRLIFAVILTSLPISIYAIIQHYGLDPLPWGGDVKERVAGNMGNAIFIAAYLIIAVFLTLERLVSSVVALLNEERGGTADALRAGAYLFILAVQLIAIVFTQSRGPWLGLAAGLYVFGILGLLLLGRWAVGRPHTPAWLSNAVRPTWLALIVLTVAGLTFVGVLNVPKGPLNNLCQQRYVGRVCTLASLSEGTNAVRVLIWEGVVDMMLKPHAPIQFPDGTPDALNALRPLIGYGPESMWVAYNRFYPPDLAHYEARNASPDRSHNETFDTLARTGLLGFVAQLFLFGSVFYFALSWLGLMEGRASRNLFLSLLVGGALLGVLIPWLVDGSLRLAGLGLPVGLIVGVILYVTIDLLLSPAGSGSGGQTESAAASGWGGGGRQLMILALFSAIVAHFVEVHFGIAIASTMTHFWILSAALVVVGMGWIGKTTEAEPVRAAAPVETRGAAPARILPPATSSAKRGGVSLPAAEAKRNAASAQAKKPAKPVEAARRQLPAERVPAATSARGQVSGFARTPLAAALPYVGISALATLVLTWNYLVNQTGAQDALTILWNAFTTRVDSASFQLVRSPMLLMLLLFTWLVGGLLALAEGGRGRSWISGAAIYAGAVVSVWFIYGLVQGNRLLLKGLTGLNIYHYLVNHITVFNVSLLVVLLGVAATLWLADQRPRPSRFTSAVPILPLVGGGLALLVALLIIVNVNLQTVQADTYYKQGLAYEGAGQWEGASILYRQAAQLEPQEDYYYLFLGRSLLQLATTVPTGTVTLPADLSKTPTEDLLRIVENGQRSRTREDVIRAAHAALVGAQRLNPLNTDHSANLARLSRTWAFVNALGPTDAPSNALLRQLVVTRPKDVDLNRLNQSLTYYKQATSLSPQNAQLWNEMSQVQFILGDTDGALQTLAYSEKLDNIFPQTFLIRGDLLSSVGDRPGALAAYRRAAEVSPTDVTIYSAIGVLSAQLGDSESAVAAFKRMVEIQSAALTSTQQQLTAHESLVARSGGYTMLLPAATNRRDALQGSIATQKSQLHLSYRNLSLVLRDSSKLTESLDVARVALTLANDSERPTIEALIADIQKRMGGK